MVARLPEDGLPFNQGCAACIMRNYKFGAITVTGGCTRRNRRDDRVPNLLANREPQSPNEFWDGDLTKVPVGDLGYMNVCVVADLDLRLNDDEKRRLLLSVIVPSIGDNVTYETIRYYLHTSTDNILVERFIWILKKESPKLYEWRTDAEALRGIADFIHYYNYVRGHSRLDYRMRWSACTEWRGRASECSTCGIMNY